MSIQDIIAGADPCIPCGGRDRALLDCEDDCPTKVAHDAIKQHVALMEQERKLAREFHAETSYYRWFSLADEYKAACAATDAYREASCQE